MNTPSLLGRICILFGKKKNSYIIVRNTAIRYARVTIVKESYESDDCCGRFAPPSSVFFGMHVSNPVPVLGHLPEDKDRLLRQLRAGMQAIPQQVLDSHPQKGSEGRML